MKPLKRIITISLCMIFMMSILSSIEPSSWLKISSPVLEAGGATIKVDDSGGKDHTTIQAAIDAASGGDIIRVFPGLYNEELLIEGKTITLIGKDMDTTIINGTGSGICVDIKSSGNNISTFSIRNGSIGILVNGTDDNYIIDCNCTLNGFAGIALNDSANNTLENNLCDDNLFGMKINNSRYNNLLNNTCNLNDKDGINVTYSDNHMLDNNTCRSNDDHGIFLDNSDWNIINNSYFQYNAIVTTAAGARFVRSNNNTLENCQLTNNGRQDMFNPRGEGLHGSETNDNLIKGNNVSNNWRFGMEFDRASMRNRITENHISSNTQAVGILIMAGCSDNRIDNNTAINNFQGIYLFGATENLVDFNNCTGAVNFGLILYIEANRNTVRDNNLSSNPASGLLIYNSNNNTIVNNTCDSNENAGIELWLNSENNDIVDNRASNNSQGISLSDSSMNNEFRGNNITKTDSQFGFYFADNTTYDNNIDRTNLVNNISIRWYTHENGISLDGLNISMYNITNVAQIMLYDCHQVNLTNSTGSNGNHGILLFSSGNNKIKYNDLSDNNLGIGLESSNWNNISNNTCHGNTQDGIHLASSENNTITGNLLMKNEGIGIIMADSGTRNNIAHHNIVIRSNSSDEVLGHDGGGGNVWDDVMSEGNFWSDYLRQHYNASHDGHVWNMSYEMNGSGGGEDRFPFASLPDPSLDTAQPAFLEDNTSAMCTTGDLFNFSINISDDIGFRKVNAFFVYIDEVLHRVKMKYFGDDNWYSNIEIRSDVTEVTYYFELEDYVANSITTVQKDVVVRDNDPPELVMDETPENATTGDEFVFTVNISDNIQVDFVNVTYSYDGFTYHNLSMNQLGDGKWNRTIIVESSVSAFEYHFYFGDDSNNTNSTQISNVDIHDNDQPTLIIDNSSPYATTGESYMFTANLSDNLNVEFARVNFTYDNITPFSFPMINPADNKWRIEIEIPENATSMNYYFFVTDSSGNALISSIRYLEVIDNDMPILDADNTLETGTTGDDFTFSVNVSDNVDIARVKVNYTYDGTSFYNISIPNIVRNGELMKYRGVVQIPADAILMEYFFYLEDTSGNVHTSSHETIYISDNDPPQVNAGKDISVDQHTKVIFDGSGCSDNIDIDEYIWSFTYDDRYYELDGEKAEFTFDEAGEYNVTLNVTDGSGNWQNDSMTVTVNDTTPPTAEAGDLFAELGEAIMFDGSRSTDNVGIVEYVWNFTYNGSNVVVTGRKINHTFQTVGDFKVTLTVKDAAGNIGTDGIVVVIFVNDISSPEADAGMDRVVAIGTKVLFDGTGSVDDIGIFNYTWSFVYDGKRIKLYGPEPEFLFNETGNYTIELIVTDGGPNTDKDEIYVLVESEGTGDDDDDTGDDDDDDNDEDDDTGGGDKDKKGVGIIWYLIIAGFFGVLLLIAIVLVVIRKKKRTEPEGKADGDETQISQEGEPEVLEPPAGETEPQVTTASLPPMEITPGLVSGADTSQLSLPQASAVEGEIETAETPTCTGCGQPSAYYPEYECYWCDSCQDYVYPAVDGEAGIETGISEEEGLIAEGEETAVLAEKAGMGEQEPALLPASTAEAPGTAEKVDLTLIPTDEMSDEKKAVIEEFNQTKIILDRAPQYINITGSMEILARAKKEIEGDDLETARASITESRDSVMAIRERYLKLVETSDMIVKSYRELQAKNVDTSQIEALFTTGKKSMESGDFTLCEQNFENVLQDIEKLKEGGDVVSGAEETEEGPKEAAAEGETAVGDEAEETTVETDGSPVEVEKEIPTETKDGETAVEPDASSEQDAEKEELESTDEPESEEVGTSEDPQEAEPETEESEKPTPDDLDDMLDDLLEGL